MRECKCSMCRSARGARVILAAVLMVAASVGAAFAADESAAKLVVSGQIEARQYHAAAGAAEEKSEYAARLALSRGPVEVDLHGRAAALSDFPADDFRRLDAGGELRLALVRSAHGVAGIGAARETRHSVSTLAESRMYQETAAGGWARGRTPDGWAVALAADAIWADSRRRWQEADLSWVQYGGVLWQGYSGLGLVEERGNVPRARVVARVETPPASVAGGKVTGYAEARGVAVRRAKDYHDGPRTGYAEGVIGTLVDLTPAVYLDFRAAHERRPEDSVTLAKTRNVASVAGGVRW